ncbi:MAG: nucleotidyltransferase domain-containing protein, partial [Nannocystaceae bacterium]
MNDIFDQRRKRTDNILALLTRSLRDTLGNRYDDFIGNHTFIYATGSCGRGEMGKGSDLDAYVVSDAADLGKDCKVLQEAIKRANTAANLPPLDGDGKHIKAIAASELIDRLGAPEDDTSEDGVFTKRMLLLLESRVILGEPAYDQVIEKVIKAYWKNEELHRANYQPFVLVNDIVRWWRIVLLNHESRVSDFLCMRQTGSGGGMFCLEVERGCGARMCSFGRGISSSYELGAGGRHVVSVTPAEAVVEAGGSEELGGH